MFNSRPENLTDIALLAECLEALSYEEIATYEDLSKIIGRDVRRCRHLLAAAQKRVERDKGVLFSCVTNVGYKRLPPSGTLTVASDGVRSCRRKASRVFSRISNGSGNSLSDNERHRLDGYRSLFGAMAAVSTEKVAKTITVESTDGALPLAKTLAVFGKILE